jgi:hypothetical protein
MATIIAATKQLLRGPSLWQEQQDGTNCAELQRITLANLAAPVFVFLAAKKYSKRMSQTHVVNQNAIPT